MPFAYERHRSSSIEGQPLAGAQAASRQRHHGQRQHHAQPRDAERTEQPEVQDQAE